MAGKPYRTIKTPPMPMRKGRRKKYAEKGDLVYIHGYSKDLNGMIGKVTHRDGGYVLVRPYRKRWEVELLENEVTVIREVYQGE